MVFNVQDKIENYTLLDTSQDLVAKLTRTHNLPRLVARVLVSLGYDSYEKITRYLSATLERDWEDPRLIPGLVPCVGRIQEAIEKHERICVFGDFDVDGVCALAIMCQALEALGAYVHPYFPDRERFDSGLTPELIDDISRVCAPKLLITLDCGIDAATAVSYAKRLGIDVVVGDHHEENLQTLPRTPYICNPKHRVPAPAPAPASYDLAGAGVALKMVCELGRRFDLPLLWQDGIELATLATLADTMVLSRENKALVQEGINRLRYTRSVGIMALAKLANIDIHSVTAEELPFSIIPRLNTAGRMNRASLAFALLTSRDLAHAGQYAHTLEELNTRRKEITASMTQEAFRAAAAQIEAHEKLIVVSSSSWEEGIKGVVSARLAHKCHVPSFVFTIHDGIAKGSGRSTGSIDLFRSLDCVRDSIIRAGGHKQAVGVTIRADLLPLFTSRLRAYLATLPSSMFADTLKVSSVVSIRELSIDDINSLELLAPFGKGNPRPLFMLKDVELMRIRRVGAHEQHLRFDVCADAKKIAAIAFGGAQALADVIGEASCSSADPGVRSREHRQLRPHVDIIFTPICEVRQGRVRPKLIVKACFPSSSDETLTQPASAPATPTPTASASMPAVSAPMVSAFMPPTPTTPAPVPVPTAPTSFSAYSLDKQIDFCVRALIGSHPLLRAQAEALKRLVRHENCLCVMATGRGKSLIFQVFSLMLALKHEGMSIFVYPLRALLSDQYEHLLRAVRPLGLKVCMLSGDVSMSDRRDIYAAIARNEMDIVLTTPEFLALHRARFGARVRFVVFDEAHHLAGAKRGNRVMYGEMPRILTELGNPCVLAVSATVSNASALEIMHLLSIRAENVLADPYIRANLHLVDHRVSGKRDAILPSIIASSKKTIVYVYSRGAAQALTNLLRHRLPHLAARIAFYHAGLSREQRRRIEEAFRTPALSALVATSAFGEGVNVGDVDAVVMYGLVPSLDDFNQMSGRAGRAGQPATIYVLYELEDIAHIKQLLQAQYPSYDDLRYIYGELRARCRLAGDSPNMQGKSATASTPVPTPASTQMSEHSQTGVISAQLNALAEEIYTDAQFPLAFRISRLKAALAIFQELGICYVSARRSQEMSQESDFYDIRMTNSSVPVMLEKSLYYCEALAMVDAFRDFCDWVYTASEHELLARINTPIYPSFAHIVGDESSYVC